jgi:hypothetical protein
MSKPLTAIRVYETYLGFQQAGFNEDQAFELTKAWMITVMTKEK